MVHRNDVHLIDYLKFSETEALSKHLARMQNILLGFSPPVIINSLNVLTMTRHEYLRNILYMHF